MKRKLEHIVRVLLVGVLLLAAAGYRNQRVLGRETTQFFVDNQKPILPPTPEELEPLIGSSSKLTALSKGIWSPESQPFIHVVSSAVFAPGIMGYGGELTLYMVYNVSCDSLMGLIPGAHNETPSFMRKVIRRGFLEQWNGLSYEKMKSTSVDAISGATMTCDAISQSVAQTCRSMLHEQNLIQPWRNALTLENGVVVFLVLLGLWVSLSRRNQKQGRLVLLVLNVIVLGFWAGKFLSFTSLMNLLSYGVDFWKNIGWVVLLMVALVAPLFGRAQHYCAWVCPYGAAQELVHRTTPWRIRFPERVARYFPLVREGVLILLLTLMWLGLGFDLVDYEPFAAFLLGKADTVVIALALLFLLLSIWTPRPWCRLLCPTGQLLRWSEKIN